MPKLPEVPDYDMAEEDEVIEEEDSIESASDTSDGSYGADELGRNGSSNNGTSKGTCKGHWSKDEVNFNVKGVSGLCSVGSCEEAWRQELEENC